MFHQYSLIRISKSCVHVFIIFTVGACNLVVVSRCFRFLSSWLSDTNAKMIQIQKKRRFQKCDTGARVVQHGPCRGTCRRWKTWQTSNTTRPPVLYNTDRVVPPEGVDSIYVKQRPDTATRVTQHGPCQASRGKISNFFLTRRLGQVGGHFGHFLEYLRILLYWRLGLGTSGRNFGRSNILEKSLEWWFKEKKDRSRAEAIDDPTYPNPIVMTFLLDSVFISIMNMSS